MPMNLNRVLRNKPWLQQKSHKAALSKWFASDDGQRLLKEEEAQLSRIVPDLFGLRCFVSGIHFPEQAMKQSIIRHQFHASVLDKSPLLPSNQYPQQLVTSLSSLPFRSDSVDAAILFHSLDFETHIYRAVKEVARVTAPGGTMVIVGFNPLSLWGLWRLCHWQSQKTAPWCSNFISMMRLSDWLKLLDFEVDGYKGAVHFPALHRSSWLDELATLQNISSRWASQFSGVYLLVAKKRVETMTLARTRWRVRKPSFVSTPLAQAHGKVPMQRSKPCDSKPD